MPKVNEPTAKQLARMESKRIWLEDERRRKEFKDAIQKDYYTHPDKPVFKIMVPSAPYGPQTVIIDSVDIPTFLKYQWYFFPSSPYTLSMAAAIPVRSVPELVGLPQKRTWPIRGKVTTIPFQQLIMKAGRGRSINFADGNTLNFRRSNLSYKKTYLKFLEKNGLTQHEISMKFKLPV